MKPLEIEKIIHTFIGKKVSITIKKATYPTAILCYQHGNKKIFTICELVEYDSLLDSEKEDLFNEGCEKLLKEKNENKKN